MPQHAAVELLHRLTQAYPHIWRNYAALQEWRRRYRLRDPGAVAAVQTLAHAPDWPDYCWAPSYAETAMLAEPKDFATYGDGRFLPQMPKAFPGYSIAALAAWRPTQTIYRFDGTLFDALADTPVTGKLPTEVLTRLPGWSVYIEIPPCEVQRREMLAGIHGIFVALDYEPIAKLTSINVVLTLDTLELLPLPLPLVGDIETGLLCAEDGKGLDKQRATVHRLLSTLMGPILYLCAEDAEVPEAPAAPPRVVETKKGNHITPIAKRPVVLDCGTRIGAVLRQARHEAAERTLPGTPTGRQVTPHIRSPHWHTFWTGPRDGVRIPKVKWLPPIRVKFDDVPEVATVRPVKA